MLYKINNPCNLFLLALLACHCYAGNENTTVTPSFNGYGIHFPQGLAAVKYIYSSEGTFKRYTALQYIYGYYSGWGGAVPNQLPTGVDGKLAKKLEAYANGMHATSTPDSNDHELFQLAPGGTTPSGVYYSSFHEHNGRGEDGIVKGLPFTQYWFDDNWLARFMSQAYGKSLPDGLWATTDFNRWQILAMDNSNWVCYENDESFVDQLALNGLYEMTMGNDNNAWNIWNSILDIAGNTYDPNNQQYSYPELYTEYFLGLFAILTQKLMDSEKFSPSITNELIQHFISLRSNILSDQQQKNGIPIGWLTGNGISNRTDPTTLINTESTVAEVLALGAGAKYSFEAGRPPLETPSGYFLRPYNALSAVVGLSPANTFMSTGPNMNFSLGTYIVDFYLRSPNPVGSIAYIDIYNSNNNSLLGSQIVEAGQMATDNQWTRISLPISVEDVNNSLEFRIKWYGTCNLDISTIRLH